MTSENNANNTIIPSFSGTDIPTSGLPDDQAKDHMNIAFDHDEPFTSHRDAGSQFFQQLTHEHENSSDDYPSLESTASTNEFVSSKKPENIPQQPVPSLFARICADPRLQRYGLILIIGLAALLVLLNVVLPEDKRPKIFSNNLNTDGVEIITSNATNNISQEELVHRHSIKIDSPMSLPFGLPPTTMELHVAPKRKFEWSTLNNTNLEAIESLFLEGPLDVTDITFLILSMPNLNSVSITLDKEICSIVDTVKDQALNEHLNIQSLTISGMETCHNFFGFMVKTFRFSKLESFTLEDVPVMFENLYFIQELLQTHCETLRRLNLINVIACHHCFLFDKIFLRWLDEAKFTFLRPSSLPAKKSLENFNLASPRITKFESNIPCLEDERKKYISNWVGIIDNYEKICFEMR